MQLTPQERQRRSDLARQLHQQGKLGARAHQSAGGQAKARNASELARQLVEQNRDGIERELRRILREGSDRSKLDAMKLLIQSGFQSEKIDQTERRTDAHERSRDDLLNLLAFKLTRTPAGALVRSRVAELSEQNVIDGTAVELPR